MHKITSHTLRLARILSALQVVAALGIGVVLAIQKDWDAALVGFAIALAAVGYFLLAGWMRHSEVKRTGMVHFKVR